MARMLRILHVVDTLATGGLERFVTDLAIAQRQAGHAVSVFSVLRCEGFRAELERSGVPVVFGDKRTGFDLGALRRLRSAARAAEVVHSHNFVPNYYAALALAGTACVLVNTCHNMGTRLSARRLRWLYRASLKRTRAVVAVGAQVRERLVSDGTVPVELATLVRNGVPMARFGDARGRRDTARAQLGLAPESLVVGCVGRLVALKNHALVIAQLPSLLARFPALRLVLLGDGPLRDALAAQAGALGLGDRVLLAGTRPDVADLLPAFDVFALPSRTEGLSIALIEACATGLPVVASAVGGNVEIVDDSHTGLLVPADDGPALAGALARLLEDRELRERIGAAARSWVAMNASIEAAVRGYDAVYLGALAR